MRTLLAWLIAVMVTVWGQPGWSHQDDPRLADLFAALQATDSNIEARVIEAQIWEIWISSGDPMLDRLMGSGIRAMNTGNFPSAMVAFNSIVEAAPDFAEGWNKRATLFWLMGDYQASIDDIDRTLELEPRHFGALSGLAMIRDAQEKPELALDALRRAVEVHPRIPNAKRRIQQLEQQLGEPI